MKKRTPLRPRNLKPINPDAAVIEQLRCLNADLSKRRSTAFYLYFPTERYARFAEAELEASGFEVTIQRSVGGSSWLCLAWKKVIPQLGVLAEIRSFLSDTAMRFEGEYDGWETQVGGDGTD